MLTKLLKLNVDGPPLPGRFSPVIFGAGTSVGRQNQKKVRKNRSLYGKRALCVVAISRDVQHTHHHCQDDLVHAAPLRTPSPLV